MSTVPPTSPPEGPLAPHPSPVQTSLAPPLSSSSAFYLLIQAVTWPSPWTLSLSHICISRLSILISENPNIHLLLFTSSATPLVQAPLHLSPRQQWQRPLSPWPCPAHPPCSRWGHFPSKGLSMSLPSAEPRGASPAFSTWLWWWPSRSMAPGALATFAFL